jgi:hypothetical protein
VSGNDEPDLNSRTAGRALPAWWELIPLEGISGSTGTACRRSAEVLRHFVARL